MENIIQFCNEKIANLDIPTWNFFFFQLVYSLEYRASEIKSALKYKEISQSGHVHTKASLESTRFSVFWHV